MKCSFLQFLIIPVLSDFCLTQISSKYITKNLFMLITLNTELSDNEKKYNLLLYK